MYMRHSQHIILLYTCVDSPSCFNYLAVMFYDALF